MILAHLGPQGILHLFSKLSTLLTHLTKLTQLLLMSPSQSYQLFWGLLCPGIHTSLYFRKGRRETKSEPPYLESETVILVLSFCWLLVRDVFSQNPLSQPSSSYKRYFAKYYLKSKFQVTVYLYYFYMLNLHSLLHIVPLSSMRDALRIIYIKPCFLQGYISSSSSNILPPFFCFF